MQCAFCANLSVPRTILPRLCVLFHCRLCDIENVLLAYHRDTDLSRRIGWFHEVVQGTFHSAAFMGDAVLLKKHLKSLQERLEAGIVGQATYASPSASLSSGEYGSSLSGAIPGGGGVGGGGARILDNARLQQLHTPQSMDGTDLAGMTALHWAVLAGHELCARILLDRGADVDALQRGGNTPLLLAAITGSETMVRLLVDNGADLTARNNKEYSHRVYVCTIRTHFQGFAMVVATAACQGCELQ